jgi:flagellar biosynthesis protein FlhG
VGRKFGVIDQAAQLRQRVAKSGTGESAVARVNASAIITPVASCRSIAVTSGKGGVGKSNISLLLAQALARCNKRVLLFDADLGLANIHILLGINPRYNLGHMLRGECTLEQILCTGPDGITLAPGASGIETIANLDAMSLERLVRQFAELEAKHDFMVIDTGAGIGQASVRLASAANSVLLVLTPEPTSLADAYATAKVLFAHGMERISVMVNMAASDREATEIFGKLQTLVKNFLHKEISLAGMLPFDKDVPRMVREQRSVIQTKPSSTFAIRIVACARMLCGMPSRSRESFFSRLFREKQSVSD